MSAGVLWDFTYAYVLPGSDLDGEWITVRAASEQEAYTVAREKVARVSSRIALRLVEAEPTRIRRGA